MLCVAQQNNDDRESHERSSGSSKSQAAQDRRIDILPAEDDDGTSMITIMIITGDIYYVYIFATNIFTNDF